LNSHPAPNPYRGGVDWLKMFMDILLWLFRKLWEFFQELLKTIPQWTKWDPIFTNGRLEIAIQISPRITIVVGLGPLGIYVRLAPGDLDDGREFDLDDGGEFDLDEKRENLVQRILHQPSTGNKMPKVFHRGLEILPRKSSFHAPFEPLGVLGIIGRIVMGTVGHARLCRETIAAGCCYGERGRS
jgi:hypothetical protein